MPSPNLSEIVTTTLRNRSGKLADSVSRNNAVLTRLTAKGKAKPFSGGRTIVQEIEYANNSTYSRYSGYELLNIQPSDVFTAAEYPIRQAAVAVSISGLELLQNAGKEQVLDLLDSRITNAERTFRNGLAYDAYSDGSLTGQITGLQALVDSSPTTGTVGGINRANWAFWQNQAYRAVTDGGAALSPSNIYEYMLTLWTRTQRGPDRIDLILADNTAWSVYNRSLHAIQRITDPSSDVAKAGFMSVKFMDADVVLDGGFQGSTGDSNTFGTAGAGAVGGAPSGTMFFINSDYLYWRPHSQRNMVPLDPDRFSVNQDAMIRLIGWAGNMCASGMVFHGVLTND
jgi:hypothetical protein